MPPLDAPPPIGPPPAGPPPPTAGMPPPPGPTQVEALSSLAGTGMQGADMLTGLRMMSEQGLQLAQQAQAMGDMQSATELAQVMNTLTNIAQRQMQGPMAGPMAGNGLGAPPPPGPSAATTPGMTSPNQATPAMMAG